MSALGSNRHFAVHRSRRGKHETRIKCGRVRYTRCRVRGKGSAYGIRHALSAIVHSVVPVSNFSGSGTRAVRHYPPMFARVGVRVGVKSLSAVMMLIWFSSATLDGFVVEYLPTKGASQVRIQFPAPDAFFSGPRTLRKYPSEGYRVLTTLQRALYRGRILDKARWIG